MTDRVYPVTVIGGGSAGVMAALRAVLNNDECLFFPGTAKHKKKSRAMWVAKVENMPGYLEYKKGIEQPNRQALEFMNSGEFQDKFFWKKNTGVESVVKDDDGLFTVTDSNGEVYLTSHVILATGVMDVQPTIEGSIAPVFPYANAQIIDYCLRCDGHHVLNKETAVIGHGSGAAWVAIMLHERYGTPNMSVLTHGKEPEFDDDVKELLELYNIDVITDEIVDVRGDQKEKRLDGFTFANGEFFDCDFAFVSLGMIVYNELAVALGAEVDQRGFVVTNQKGETNIANLYVAGDLRANTKKQIYTAWDTAVDSADDINAKLRREKRNALLCRKRDKNCTN